MQLNPVICKEKSLKLIATIQANASKIELVLVNFIKVQLKVENLGGVVEKVSRRIT